MEAERGSGCPRDSGGSPVTDVRGLGLRSRHPRWKWNLLKKRKEKKKGRGAGGKQAGGAPAHSQRGGCGQVGVTVT